MRVKTKKNDLAETPPVLRFRCRRRVGLLNPKNDEEGENKNII